MISKDLGTRGRTRRTASPRDVYHAGNCWHRNGRAASASRQADIDKAHARDTFEASGLIGNPHASRTRPAEGATMPTDDAARLHAKGLPRSIVAPRWLWSSVLLGTIGLLYLEAHTQLDLVCGALLLPLGLGCAWQAFVLSSHAQRATVFGGTLLLWFALHCALAVFLAFELRVAFGNHRDAVLPLLSILILLCASLGLTGAWLVRRALPLANWPVLFCWLALLGLEVGAFNLERLIRFEVFSPQPSQSYRG